MHVPKQRPPYIVYVLMRLSAPTSQRIHQMARLKRKVELNKGTAENFRPGFVVPSAKFTQVMMIMGESQTTETMLNSCVQSTGNVGSEGGCDDAAWNISV